MSKLIRWLPSEQRQVASYALPLMDEHGMQIVDAFMKAQKVALPRVRWHSIEALRRMNYGSASSTMRRIVEEARKNPGHAPAPAPKPKPPSPTGKTLTRWTTHENALLARHVKAMQDAGDTRSLALLCFEAQQHVLPPDRHRSKDSLLVTRRTLVAAHENGLRNIWTLPPLPAPAAPASELTPEPPPAPQESAPAPAPAATQATQAPPILSRHSGLSDAARAFGDTVMGALDTLLSHHASLIMAEVQSRMGRLADQVAASLTDNIKVIVHGAIEKELGPIGPTEEPPRPRRLVVDVVGLIGQQVEEVRKSFNGDTDIRFISADHGGTWSPRTENCVLVTKFISHDVQDKVKSWGFKPVFANGGAASVIEAIEGLRKQRGFPPRATH